MSTNLDLVRSIYADWERGDFSKAEWADPDIEYIVVGGPSPGSGRGLSSMAQAMADYAAPWRDYRVEVEECRVLDKERVLVLVRQHGTGRASNLDLSDMQTEAANVMHVRGGVAVKLVVYWDRDRALADLGLEG